MLICVFMAVCVLILMTCPRMARADESGKGKVIILATGGTIAGVGESGRTSGYRSGSLSVEEVLQEVPGLEKIARLETIQVCNVNSDDMTDEIWLHIVDIINRRALEEDVRGFVITHGTDTMEETAYFLNLTVKTEKPVVLTGSMRPSTAISADGPMNLYQAVCVAASDAARRQGVLIVFSDRIYTARTVIKSSTDHVTAITAGELGPVGVVRDGRVFLYESTAKVHTLGTVFNVTGMTALPKVSVVYFAVDADPDLLLYAAAHADGLVIAGAGAGEFSKAFAEAIGRVKVPVVVASRIDDGMITRENLLCENTIPADNLSPQKAAVLLRLALTVTRDAAYIAEMFQKY